MLNVVGQETLRLYGAAPEGLPRRVPAGAATMGDCVLAEGTKVTTQAYTFHRDSSFFTMTPKSELYAPSTMRRLPNVTVQI